MTKNWLIERVNQLSNMDHDWMDDYWWLTDCRFIDRDILLKNDLIVDQIVNQGSD